MGEFSLSGVFPETPLDPVSRGKLELILCRECTLVQLSETFSSEEMYGDNYGYRSGLNLSMVNHLKGIVEYAKSFVEVTDQDAVLDIGSNDGTLLRHWLDEPGTKIGIDPTAKKFAEFYDSDTKVVPDFFTNEIFTKNSPAPAKVITSIAMLYDLESPIDFVKDVAASLDKSGVWVSEQSYMPWMILTGAYDTICHEHIEYYSLTSLSKMLEKAGLVAIDAVINDANGGSIRLAVGHSNAGHTISQTVKNLLNWEETLNLGSEQFFEEFSKYVMRHGEMLRATISELVADGKKVAALGASTKGSILIQHAKLGADLVEFIGEVNPFKFGRFMANSDIPIISETPECLKEMDYLIILPWHFKQTFAKNLKGYSESGGSILWPLPGISETSSNGMTESIFRISEEDFSDSPLRSTQFS